MPRCRVVSRTIWFTSQATEEINRWIEETYGDISEYSKEYVKVNILEAAASGEDEVFIYPKGRIEIKPYWFIEEVEYE